MLPFVVCKCILITYCKTAMPSLIDSVSFASFAWSAFWVGFPQDTERSGCSSERCEEEVDIRVVVWRGLREQCWTCQFYYKSRSKKALSYRVYWAVTVSGHIVFILYVLDVRAVFQYCRTRGDKSQKRHSAFKLQGATVSVHEPCILEHRRCQIHCQEINDSVNWGNFSAHNLVHRSTCVRFFVMLYQPYSKTQIYFKLSESTFFSDWTQKLLIVQIGK